MTHSADGKVLIYDQDGTDLEDDVTSGNALDNLGTIVIQQFIGPVPAGGHIKSGCGKFTQDAANYRLDYRRKR